MIILVWNVRTHKDKDRQDATRFKASAGLVMVGKTKQAIE